MAIHDVIDAVARYIVENDLLAKHGVADDRPAASAPALDRLCGNAPTENLPTHAGAELAADAPVILKPREVADLLRVNISTLYPMLSSGKVPGAKKIGGEWRIRRDLLLNWFQGEGRISHRRS